LKVLSILFAMAGLFAGLMGAYYWYLSSTVPIERWGGNAPVPFPEGHQREEMLDRMTGMNTLWLGGMVEAAQKTARLNKVAARWTASPLSWVRRRASLARLHRVRTNRSSKRYLRGSCSTARHELMGRHNSFLWAGAMGFLINKGGTPIVPDLLSRASSKVSSA